MRMPVPKRTDPARLVLDLRPGIDFPEDVDVVLAGLYILAHADLRRLSNLGYSVLGLSDDPLELRLRSRHGSKLRCPNPDIDFNGWVAFMEQLGSLCTKKPALIATSDRYVLALDRAADSLRAYFRFHGFGSGLRTQLTSKRMTFTLAEKHRLPAPKTWFVGSRDDLQNCLPKVGGPVLIKPEFSPHWRTREATRVLGAAKAMTADSRQDLVTLYERVADFCPNVVVQENIPGPDRDLIYFAAFVGPDHRTRGRIVGRKVRITPVHYGSASFVELVDMREVESQCERFLEAIGYVGRCGIELKLDARDGVGKLIEINPRPGIWENLGIPAGVDLAGECVASLFGADPAPSRATRYNIRWLHVGRDITALREYRAEGSIGLWAWLKSLKPPMVVTDMPFLSDLPYALSNLGTLARQLGLFVKRRVRRAASLAPNLLLAAVLAGALTTGCGRSREPTASGGRVVVGQLSEPKTLNPLLATSATTQDIINLIFLRLAREKDDFLTLEPVLAESWSFGADSLTLTFNLRSDARWHDGEPVTAHDVRFTWQMQRHPEVAWAGRRLKDRIKDVEVIDDHTVRFHFTARYLYQLQDAADGVIMPRHVLVHVPPESLATCAFSREPVGCGPYRFGRWVNGQFIELERNSDYYVTGQPHIEKVAFRFVPDINNLVTQLKTGEIDCLEAVPIDAVKDIRENYPDVNIYTYLSRGMVFVTWNLENEILADHDLRRALAMAINAPEIIETLWGGMAQVSDSPMHPLLWAHNSAMQTIAFDPQGAREALASLGWRDTNRDGVLDKDGRPLEFAMTTNQGVQVRVDVMTMVQEYLRRVGVKVDTQVLEWNAFIQGVVKGEFDSCVLGWVVETRADLTTFWHSTSTPPGGFNASRYKNPRVDSLIERARDSIDQGQARELWFECQQRIYEDQPIYFLSVPYNVVGLRDNFCSVEPSIHGFFVNLPQWQTGDACR